MLFLASGGWWVRVGDGRRVGVEEGGWGVAVLAVIGIEV